MQELTQSEFDNIMDRYPAFELSYETISHKKVSPSYNICLAIPHGKKFIIWYTFYGTDNVCLLLHINKDKKISKIVNMGVTPALKLSLGTILYGSMIEPDLMPSEQALTLKQTQQIFVIEDIYYFEGIPLKKCNFRERWDFIYHFISKYANDSLSTVGISMTLPLLWENKVTDDFECSSVLPRAIQDKLGYVVHHIQYRSFQEIVPYLNVLVARKVNLAQVVKSQPPKPIFSYFDTEAFIFDYSRPQYRYPTVFQVSADIQFDVYHLFAFGKNGKPVYYGVAGIPNYKTSIFMNSLFRKIKENANLDAIEESDDEEEFQDISEDKYVDMNKILLMECTFHTKFKKWIPLRVVDKYSKIVHITRLIQDEVNVSSNNPSQYENRNHIPNHKFREKRLPLENMNHSNGNNKPIYRNANAYMNMNGYGNLSLSKNRFLNPRSSRPNSNNSFVSKGT